MESIIKHLTNANKKRIKIGGAHRMFLTEGVQRCGDLVAQVGQLLQDGTSITIWPIGLLPRQTGQ